MCKKIKRAVAFLICAGMLITFSGCTLKELAKIGNVPPKIESIETIFDRCQEKIEMVRTYMASLGYEDAYIDKADGTFFSDFKWRNIDDEEVCAALQQLWKQGVIKIAKRSDLNSIEFTMWRGIRDIRCGIAYPLDDTKALSVQYLTSLQTFKNGWSYFVADYNEWRN